ncbi:acylphosphatase [Corynebacterium mayonis]|uniref:acylphosphatase n=1 Tax=Corynebacterium mayonis TaxID=3062461 RepID=UPI00314074CE
MSETASAHTRMTAFVRGQVQGVGFRWWTRSRALELGLSGHATNLSDGRVQVVAEGEAAAAEQLLTLLREDPSGAQRPGRVDFVAVQYSTPRGEKGFTKR